MVLVDTYTVLQTRLLVFSVQVLKLKWNEPLIDVLVESRTSVLTSSDFSVADGDDDSQPLNSSLRSVQTFGLWKIENVDINTIQCIRCCNCSLDAPPS